MEEEWLDAARTGNDLRVAKLLAMRPNLIKVEDQTAGNTALHFAAEAGHEPVVARLLAASPTSLHTKNIRDQTALDMAASNGHDKVVAQMLATDVVGIHISRGLFEAVKNNHDKVVDVLLAAQGHNFTLSGTDAVFALFSMIYKEQKSLAQLMAIRPGVLEEIGVPLLHHAASRGHDLMWEILELRPKLIDAVSVNRNVLMYAVEYDQQRMAEELLAMKPELIFFVSHHGDTVLHHAVAGGNHPRFVAKLWRMNPQALTQATADLQTPFHEVVEASNNELIELFQWSLSFDDIVSAFTHHRMDYQERYRPVMEQLCESLFVSLNRDVATTVLEYVGIDCAKHVNKRTKLSSK